MLQKNMVSRLNKSFFEITEGEQIEDYVHHRGIVEYYKKRGFMTPIDDFRAGYAGLNQLAEIQTDIVKRIWHLYGISKLIKRDR